jgi:hypothetical protein
VWFTTFLRLRLKQASFPDWLRERMNDLGDSIARETWIALHRHRFAGVVHG